MSRQASVKISVVGVGHVGSVTAFTLAIHGLAGEIVLCARDGEDEAARASQQRAAMDALDIKHAITCTSHRLEVREASAGSSLREPPRGQTEFQASAKPPRGQTEFQVNLKLGLTLTPCPPWVSFDLPLALRPATEESHTEHCRADFSFSQKENVR